MKMKEELSTETTADAKEASSAVETIVMRKVEARSRPTIMSGRVWDFSDKFELVDGIFGKSSNAVGCFHISASRDEVIVHFANLKKDEDFKLFQEALEMAKDESLALSRKSYA